MKGETNMKFSSKKFKEIRKKSGLSQLELAIRASEIDGCAITDKIISAWENNTSIQPRQYNLEAVAKVLGVNVYDFYSDEERLEDLCLLKDEQVIFASCTHEEFCYADKKLADMLGKMIDS